MMDAAMLLALLGAGLLSYHGGLHAWQAPVAAAALLGALWAGRDRLPSCSGLDAWERALALLWAALLPGALLGLRPQFSLNAWAVVGALLALLALLRRSPRPLLGAVQGWVLVSGVLYSALFLAYGFFAVGGYAGEELYGPVVRPHISARLFQPNQNLLAGGYSLPALLLATALWLGAVRKSSSVALAAVALLTGATVVYAGSRGVYLALTGGLAWMGLRWAAPRVKAVIVFGLLLAVIALGAWKAPFSILAYRMTAQAEGKPAADTNNLRRKDFWAGAARLSLERPLLGHGLAGFSAAALRLDLPTALTERQPIARYRLRLEHAHNEWLELAVEAGWPVALGVAILVLAWLRRRWRSGASEPAVLGLEAGVVAAFILSLTDMNLRTPALAWSMLLVLAALEPLGSRSDSKSGRSQLALLGGLFALVLCVGWHQRQSLSLQRKAGEAVSPRRVKAALWLQPLDSELGAWNLDQSGTTWPLAPWAGRRDPVWHLSRSSQAGLQGDVAAGLEATRRAIECRPYHAPYHLLLAQRLEATGHAEEAAQEVREALRLEPNYGQALVWQIERAPNMEKGALLERLRQAQKLRVTFEEPDPYSLGIQYVDPKWLSEKLRN